MKSWFLETFIRLVRSLDLNDFNSWGRLGKHDKLMVSSGSFV